MLVQKDIGGNEFYQIYAMKDGRLDLLTDGKSRNGFNAWSKDGTLLAYTSTRRNGRDSDILLSMIRPKGGGSTEIAMRASRAASEKSQRFGFLFVFWSFSCLERDFRENFPNFL